MNSSTSVKVMIAGVGGASLGTEICKSLRLAGGYQIYGCDISSTAYGLYSGGFEKTFKLPRESYVESVLQACVENDIRILVPGGEQPMVLLGAATEKLNAAGITLLANSAAIVAGNADKNTSFKQLARLGIAIPKTKAILEPSDMQGFGLPCIIKPATGSGGSVSVFFAVSIEEALIYADFIRRSGNTPIAQEYVNEGEGEFTIGVLSLPDQTVVGAIAMRRALDAKLSVAYRGRGGLISSGYSQGHIGQYSELCHQAQTIARAIGSCGPINIQGRVRNGILLPFEINPRFSASTYLRAMAGFNEIDILIQYHLKNSYPSEISIKPGWYLRSLTEQFVHEGELK